MRLLLDEMLAPAIAHGLRARGVDAVSVAELRLEGASDASLLQLGREERRVVITKNTRDFRVLQIEALRDGAGHHGLVLLAADIDTSRAAIGRMVRALLEVAAARPGDDDLRDREVWL